MDVGGPLEVAVGEHQLLHHHEPTIKKPRQGSGAQDIQQIREIRLMKPLMRMKGSSEGVDHRWVLALIRFLSLRL